MMHRRIHQQFENGTLYGSVRNYMKINSAYRKASIPTIVTSLIV